MRDPCSGSGLTANRINQPNASGLYPAFNNSSCSPRPALCYRPLRTLPQSSCDGKGDLVRAPDAAPTGKTSEAVKERVWFYSSYSRSQQKSCACKLFIFNRMQAVHRHMPRNWCNPSQNSLARSRLRARFLGKPAYPESQRSIAGVRDTLVKIRGETALLGKSNQSDGEKASRPITRSDASSTRSGAKFRTKFPHRPSGMQGGAPCA
jgi:hypothetical protein